MPSQVGTLERNKASTVTAILGWFRDSLNYRPILMLLGIGFVLRVALMIMYYPAIMLWYDSIRYARVEPRHLFADFWMPAGYPMLLALLKGISRQVWLTIAVQHLMGLSTGVMLFLSMRRLNIPSWIASIPAAVVFLSGDHLYFEHVIMADSYFIALTAAGLMAAVYALTDEINLFWLCAASTLLALASLTRSVGLVLPPTLIVCALVWVRASLPKRLRVLTAAIVPGIAVFGLYWIAFVATGGKYLGLSDMSGWNFYARVAPFADCRKFSVPSDTAILCEERPLSQRPGPFGYVWDLNSTARRSFELNPISGKKLGEFAWQVITHQPADYVHAVLMDLARYIEPTIGGPRAFSGQPREIVWFGWRDQSLERFIVGYMSKKYLGTKVRVHGGEMLGAYQNLFRVGGLVLAVLICLTLIGMIRARGRLRLGIFLFGLVAFGLFFVPVMTLSYDFRYGIPAETFVVVSGLIGAWSLRSASVAASN